MTNVTTHVERPKHLPDFAEPPLDEVVLGVQFEPIPDFTSVHAYPIWELFREAYPTTKERALLDPKFETFGGLNPRGNIEFKVGSPPVGSRHWFVSADKTHLLQLQANRFLINWRKRPGSESYPRFENVAAEFNRNLLTLSNHLRSELSYEININQAEVSYINVISAKGFSEAGQWFSIWKPDPIEIEALNASFSEICRNENGNPFARLYHEVQCGQKSDGTRAFRYSLDFRGKPHGSDISAAMQFVYAGREIIVMRFDQLTTESAHTHWRNSQMNALSLRSSAFQTNQGFFGRLDNPISISDSRLAVNQSTYVRVDRTSSPWFEALREKFDELCSLAEGWDGYTGFSVSFSNANFAADILERLYSDGVPPPSIVPGSDGSLQLEWHRNQFDVEIDVLAPYQVVATRTNLVTDIEEEIELDSDFTALEEWICDLKSLDDEYEQLVA